MVIGQHRTGVQALAAVVAAALAPRMSNTIWWQTWLKLGNPGSILEKPSNAVCCMSFHSFISVNVNVDER